MGGCSCSKNVVIKNTRVRKISTHTEQYVYLLTDDKKVKKFKVKVPNLHNLKENCLYARRRFSEDMVDSQCEVDHNGKLNNSN